MKYKDSEKHIQPEDRLVTDVISSFRSFSPSYDKTKIWYLENKPQEKPKKVASPFLFKYSLPIFGSVFASTFALVMILTSQNAVVPNGEMVVQVDTARFSQEPVIESDVAPMGFSGFAADTAGSEMMMAKTAMMPEPTLVEKLEEQSKVASRTPAEEDSTETSEMEPSFDQLFQ